MVDFPDPTSFLQLINQRRQMQLQAEELEFRRQQERFDQEMNEESLKLRKASQLESEMNSEVSRRLGEMRIKESEAEQKAFEQGAELLGLFQARFSGASSPQELEANAGAAEKLIGTSKTFDGVRKIKGGVQAALGTMFKSFSSAAENFAAAADPSTRLDIANLITTEGTALNRAASPEQKEKARREAPSQLSELTGVINQLPNPNKVIDPAGGVLPTDFARIGQSVLSKLDEIERTVGNPMLKIPGDPRLDTPDAAEEIAVARNAIKASRDTWNSKLGMLRRVEAMRESALSGVAIQSSPGASADLNEYYQTFTQPMVRHAPLPQAVQSMQWYAKTGLIPDAMLSDLTNTAMYDSPEGAYRASALVETVQLSGNFSSQAKLLEAFADEPNAYDLTNRINSWRQVNRRKEIAAFGSNDPDMLLAVAGEAYVRSIAAKQAADEMAAGVNEDIAAKDTETKGTTVVGGESVDIFVNRTPVTSRDIARSIMHDVNGWFKSSLAEKLNWNQLDNRRRDSLTDDFQRIYEEQLARVGESMAVDATVKELRTSWGPEWVGPNMGSGSAPFHPKKLAEEQGVDYEEGVAESIARIQLDKEVLQPFRERTGKMVSFSGVRVQEALGIDDKGVQRTGYIVTDLEGASFFEGVQKSQLWFPDFKAEDIDSLISDTDDGRRLRRMYEGDAGFGSSGRANTLWRLENRLHEARRVFSERPSPSARNEVNKAELRVLDFMGIESDPDELLRVPAGPQREALREKIKAGGG